MSIIPGEERAVAESCTSAGTYPRSDDTSHASRAFERVDGLPEEEPTSLTMARRLTPKGLRSLGVVDLGRRLMWAGRRPARRRPGSHSLAMVLPSGPSTVRVDALRESAIRSAAQGFRCPLLMPPSTPERSRTGAYG